ncbi:MAG: phosphatase PAP2 family protein [Legionellales bacterium]|nr:phosphatase PAP2 family protein [Legionellales bacterium]
MKKTFNVTRPDGGKYSFPSGHAGDAFVGAGYLHMRYGFKWAAPAYIAASFVAHSRVYAKRHRPIDVIVGAAIAITTSYFTVKPYKNMQVNVQPIKNGGALSVKYAV